MYDTALCNGWKDTAYALVDLGANYKIRNKYKMDATEYAAKKGFFAAVKEFRAVLLKREMMLSNSNSNSLVKKVNAFGLLGSLASDSAAAAAAHTDRALQAASSK